jgi:hypothetical protein
MGEGTFILLKAGRCGQKSAKQAEIRLAVLLKILGIAYGGLKASLARADGTCNGLDSAGYG